ncbi:type II toxin-antitoxin system Rv0910 family toxin [Cryptosporangium japonicum]|uniref:Polyketide cyclase n=1 Tax=Cryptosporangium japonicum TaxID=80872 RepID=A0ABN0TK68_9ACTN
MAHASTTAQVSGTVDSVWQTFVDFGRYPEWVAFHKQWLEEPPSGAEVGATLKQSVAILGAPTAVNWEIVTADCGELLELAGRTTTGVDARLALRAVSDGGRVGVTLDLTLTGGPVIGPIGTMIQKAAQKLVDTSAQRFPS